MGRCPKHAIAAAQEDVRWPGMVKSIRTSVVLIEHLGPDGARRNDRLAGGAAAVAAGPAAPVLGAKC